MIVFFTSGSQNPKMAIFISENNNGRGYDCRTYDVTIDGFNIKTVVTKSSARAGNWIRAAESANHYNRSNLVVGLDVEWHPSFTPNIHNPVAIVQLCVGSRCLVYQILRSGSHCSDLERFLGGSGYKFVGVGIGADVQKLERGYGLQVLNSVDLRHVAAAETGNRWMRNAGMKTLAEHVLGMDMEKPRWITTSDWDREWLSLDQVKYAVAVADAYVSYKLGTVLQAYRYSTS